MQPDVCATCLDTVVLRSVLQHEVSSVTETAAATMAVTEAPLDELAADVCIPELTAVAERAAAAENDRGTDHHVKNEPLAAVGAASG